MNQRNTPAMLLGDGQAQEEEQILHETVSRQNSQMSEFTVTGRILGCIKRSIIFS